MHVYSKEKIVKQVVIQPRLKKPGNPSLNKICSSPFLGTKWRHIGGEVTKLEAGPNGVVWGTSREGYIFYRSGVMRRNPIGTRWIRIRGKLSHVTVGCTGVYGVNKARQVWRYKGK